MPAECVLFENKAAIETAKCYAYKSSKPYVLSRINGN